jgi:hypothetical protein
LNYGDVIVKLGSMRILYLISAILLCIGCTSATQVSREHVGETKMSSFAANYGVIYPFQRGTLLKFADFTITYLGFENVQVPVTASITREKFLVVDRTGNRRELAITYGQTPPQPMEFTVENMGFVLRTFSMPDGQRIDPGNLAIFKK